jgi:3-hydroxybutyryl-CoA dehydratase
MTQFALTPGTRISSPFRAMTRERMRWYVDAQPTIAADDGRIHTQEPTIHDDDDYAKAQGLPGIIADGMISTNWIHSLLIDIFGAGVNDRSRLSTKYVAPVYENDRIRSIVEIEQVLTEADGPLRISCKVWCEDDKGRVVTFGAATVWI